MNNKRKNIILCIATLVSTVLSFALAVTRQGYNHGGDYALNFYWIYDLIFAISIGGTIGSIANYISYCFKKIDSWFEFALYFFVAASAYVTYKYIDIFYGITHFNERVFVYIGIAVTTTVIAAFLFKETPVKPEETVDELNLDEDDLVIDDIRFEIITDEVTIINNRHFAHSFSYYLNEKDDNKGYTYDFSPNEMFKIKDDFLFYSIVDENLGAFGYVICKAKNNKLIIDELILYNDNAGSAIYKKIISDLAKENNVNKVHIKTNLIMNDWYNKCICNVVSDFVDIYNKTERGIDFMLNTDAIKHEMGSELE